MKNVETEFYVNHDTGEIKKVVSKILTHKHGSIKNYTEEYHLKGFGGVNINSDLYFICAGRTASNCWYIK